MFLYEGSKRSQNFGSNRSQFTYSCELLNIRERQSLQDKVDVFNILYGMDQLPSFRLLAHTLNGWMTDLTPDLRGDMLSNGKHLGKSWILGDLARSNFPWQLTEGIRSDLDDPNMLQIPEFENQILAQHGVYSKAVLVRDMFQCFHRNDGMTPNSPTNCYH